MPFPGASLEDTVKIDRCVKKVMAKQPDLSKQSAIKICRASIEGKEAKMVKKRKGLTARQRRKEQKRLEALETQDALELAENPMADIEAEDIDYESEDYFDEEYADKMQDFLSLEEVDQAKEEELKEAEIEEVFEDSEVVLSAIAETEELDLEGKAEAVEQLGVDASERIKDIIGETDDVEAEIDWEVLEFDAFAYQFGEKQGLIDSLKAKLTGSARNNLPDSAFACIMPGGKKDAGGKTTPRRLRRFPIHDKAHIRAALSRLPQAKPNVAACARSKVLAAARGAGIGKPAKDYPTGFTILKDKNGDMRWLGWTTNRWKDRDGEILTDASHKEFVEFLNENPGNAPAFLSWHVKETRRENPVDAWLYENGFMIYSGVLTDTEALSLLNVAQKTKLGMSHGLIPLERSPANPTEITKYRTFEVSDLPLHQAANVFTNLEVIVKEVVSMDKKKYLEGIIGEEAVAKLLENTEVASALLDDAGVESKEKEEEGGGSSAPPSGVSPELFKVIEEGLGIKELGEELAKIDKRLSLQDGLIKALSEQLLKSEDEVVDQLGEMIAGGVKKRFAWQEARASEKEDTVLDEKDEKDAELLEAIPTAGEDWLSTMFNAAAIQGDLSAEGVQ